VAVGYADEDSSNSTLLLRGQPQDSMLAALQSLLEESLRAVYRVIGMYQSRKLVTWLTLHRWHEQGDGTDGVNWAQAN
jgi:hypothetical protein